MGLNTFHALDEPGFPKAGHHTRFHVGQYLRFRVVGPYETRESKILYENLFAFRACRPFVGNAEDKGVGKNPLEPIRGVLGHPPVRGVRLQRLLYVTPTR